MRIFTPILETITVAPPDKKDLLDAMESYALTFPHGEGRTRVSDRVTYLSLIDIARRFGTVVDPLKGIEVAASQRQIADKASIGRLAVSRAKQRLDDEGLLYYVAAAKDDWRLDDEDTRIWSRYGLKRLPEHLIVMTLPPPSDVNTRLIRNPSSVTDALGKGKAWVLDLILAKPGISLEELAEILRIRKNNLKNRYMNLLLEDMYISEEDGGYYPAWNLGELLQIHHKVSGSEIAAENQHTRHEEERIKLAQGKRKYRTRKQESNPKMFGKKAYT
jgi:hypothetical protein